MERERGSKVWMLWLGSLIAVSGGSAYLANPQAAKRQYRAAKAAYHAAVKPAPAASQEPEADLRDSVSALPTASAVGAPAARLPSRPPTLSFPTPKRVPVRKPVRRVKSESTGVSRPVFPETEEEFLRLYQVAAPRKLATHKSFAVSGEVFDLDSGAYLEGASLYFRDPKTGESFLVKTNDWGEYSLRLPVNIDGYRLSVFKKGYRHQYLRDWSPSMKEADPSIRKQVAAELLALRFEGLLVFYSPREDQVLDFALIPR
ncbi:MAG: hypothetical protein CO113_07840 [Elusimicrobia bacterium CG_4_9_14_3_um_filter_62_55]|nr:MAG: hypothetical protein COR54_07745 [Elusimicrobia bacterium CG22_combo_CG10-13_8_21_14_all_63_91]PJA16784.1 MAG: hypothetical protein COX66_06600 [Elusimicrobia bacterium CG_4_10_14_0_2_um_filter_63_34]PJB25598.1 MAG: hypothetical protein CO113_07840 [Elusimicrobia bacterium CG_4_9_14_3_um_filter_62_55]